MSSSLCDLLESVGINYHEKGQIYRGNAYLNAVHLLKNKEGITSREAIKLKGIGKSIAKKIKEFNETGTIAIDVDKVLKLFMSIHGVGPKQSRLWIEEGYKTLDDLKDVKMTHSQQLGYKYVDDLNEKIPRDEIRAIEEYIKDRIPEAVVCGSYRRGAQMSGDVDVLVKGGSVESAIKSIEGILIGTLSLGKNKYMGLCRVLDKVRRIDILIIKDDSWYYSLLYFTGSKKMNITMRGKAKSMGYSLNEYGLSKGDESIPAGSEEEIFKALEMKYLNPEERGY
uniref:DNA polymerase family X n=1 Tax=Pithovirus LCPAC401 TaxID=2506595 RepID=A0A481ZBX4_9VIRU|nr:MAG: DNA polymerase family X [Pithovirus LCPAC401]